MNTIQAQPEELTVRLLDRAGVEVEMDRKSIKKQLKTDCFKLQSNLVDAIGKIKSGLELDQQLTNLLTLVDQAQKLDNTKRDNKFKAILPKELLLDAQRSLLECVEMFSNQDEDFESIERIEHINAMKRLYESMTPQTSDQQKTFRTEIDIAMNGLFAKYEMDESFFNTYVHNIETHITKMGNEGAVATFSKGGNKAAMIHHASIGLSNAGKNPSFENNDNIKTLKLLMLDKLKKLEGFEKAKVLGKYAGVVVCGVTTFSSFAIPGVGVGVGVAVGGLGATAMSCLPLKYSINTVTSIRLASARIR